MRRTSTLSVGALACALLVTGLAACQQSEPRVVSPAEETSTPPPTSTPPLLEPTPLAEIDLGFELVADGFDQPLYVTGAGDGSGRLFVVEKTGRIWILRDGERAAAPFLDLSDAVSTDSERGLLGLAFSPDFSRSGLFYVDYTDRDGDTVVSRMRAEGDAAVPGSDEVMLTIDQPFANHNGGMIAFGPDGYLYIGTGDGGSGGDPQGNGQDLATLLGKILRIDVDPGVAGESYAVPPDNPFGDARQRDLVPSDARAEIWAFGLRNPWRFSFDRETDDLWIGDVGQNAWEEIDFQPAASDGGENYGWNVYEGAHTFPPGSPESDDPGDFTMPVIEYDRDAGNSVTGGYVYRGNGEPALWGTYVYGDYGSGAIWGLQRAAGGVENRRLADTDFAISSFGEDDGGELYVVDIGGAVFRVIAE